MNQLLDDAAELYPIRTVAAITGINPVTLRAWERRYALITPRRTESGHRVYSARDIDTINRAVLLVEKGHSISHVARMLKAAAQPASKPEAVSGSTWQDYRNRMLASIAAFREDELDDVYNEALALYALELVNRNLIIPVLNTLGERWQGGVGSVAEEHFFTCYLRNKLGARFHHHGRRNLGPLLVTACLPGETHETGLLLFSLSALDRGFRLISLGADMPLDELAVTARRSAADGIVLSGRVDPEQGVLGPDLAELVRRCGVPVFIGGRVSETQENLIGNSGAIALGDDIGNALVKMETHFGNAARQAG